MISRTCDRSTDYHFSSLSEQIDFLVGGMGKLRDSNNNNKSESLFYERDGGGEGGKEEGEKEERGAKEGKGDFRVGDFVITRFLFFFFFPFLFSLSLSPKIGTLIYIKPIYYFIY